MLHLAQGPFLPGPSVRELRERFPDLKAASIPAVRRSFNITSHTAERVLRIAREQDAGNAPQSDVEKLMARFGFSEEEARWAIANVGMPE
jgi:hypothetical protein